MRVDACNKSLTPLDCECSTWRKGVADPSRTRGSSPCRRGRDVPWLNRKLYRVFQGALVVF